MTTRKEHKIYLDILRILSAFLVIFNHTGNRGMGLFTVKQDSPYFLLYECISIFIRCAVPIFFTISGGLLLSRDEPLRKVFSRIGRYLAIILIFSGIVYTYMHFYAGQIYTLDHFITLLYTGNAASEYWFLYSYVAFLIMLPFLRALARGLSNKQFHYLFGIFFAFKILQIAEFLIWHGQFKYSSNLETPMLNWNILYPLLGYYIENRMDARRMTGKTVIGLSLAGLGAMIVTCLLTNYRCRLMNNWVDYAYFYNSLLLVPVCAIYVAAKYLCQKIRFGKMWGGVVQYVSSCTFGIYLFEKISRNTTAAVFEPLDRHLPTIVACGIYVLCAYMFGLVITSVLKKLPVFRRLL